MTAVERVDLQCAFVLHSRIWRETSELLEVLTRDHGRVSLVARGMRRRRSVLRAILQPFQPLVLSWSGRGEGLMTLRTAEAAGPAVPLHGIALMSGFYANELLLRFLQRGDSHPRLFASYEKALLALAGGDLPEAVLRRFELALLAETGYGLNLDHDAASGEPLDAARCYQYVLERGPVAVADATGAELVFSGAQLLSIGAGAFGDPRCLAAARHLLRAVLDHHLGGRPLRTREVLGAMRQRPGSAT